MVQALSLVYFDTETEPIRHDEAQPRLVQAAFAIDDGPVTLCSADYLCALLRQHTGVGHATAFDLAALGLGPHQVKPWRDTAIRATLLGAANGEPNGVGHSLKLLAKRLGIVLEGKKTVQLSFRQGHTLTEEQVRYLKQDVEATRAVFKSQQGGAEVSPDERNQTALSWDVWLMSRRGLHIDQERLEQLKRDSGYERLRLWTLLKDAGIIQPRGPKKQPWRDWSVDHGTVQALLAKAGASRMSEGGGALAADEEALRASGSEVLGKLAEYKTAEKWYSLLEAYDVGPVARCSYKTLVASGRISASKPNITQIPRKGGLREIIVPSPGNKLVAADFASLEFKCWAHLCHVLGVTDEPMRVYLRGQDPHLVIASQVLDVSYEAAQVGRAAADPTVLEARQLAKIANYGLIGGMGINRLHEQILERFPGFERYRAQALRNVWYKTYGARAYFDWLQAAEVRFTGGHHRVALPHNGRVRYAFYSEAANYMIQGTGADVAKWALVLCHRAGLPVVALIHDEILLDSPENQAEYHASLLQAAMAQAGREICPSVPWDDTEVEIMDRWHSKGA